MKKILVFLLGFLFVVFAGFVYADNITLNSTEVLSTPNAAHMNWHISKIDAKAKVLQVKYQWLDATGMPIRLGNKNTWHTWLCRNIIDNPVTINTECLGVDDPWDCCTGVGTGDCDESTTDFSDIFSFSIRAQDVDTAIGVGLRTLIWNKMKDDILTGGNDGTFTE